MRLILLIFLNGDRLRDWTFQKSLKQSPRFSKVTQKAATIEASLPWTWAVQFSTLITSCFSVLSANSVLCMYQEGTNKTKPTNQTPNKQTKRLYLGQELKGIKEPFLRALFLLLCFQPQLWKRALKCFQHKCRNWPCACMLFNHWKWLKPQVGLCLSFTLSNDLYKELS